MLAIRRKCAGDLLNERKKKNRERKRDMAEISPLAGGTRGARRFVARYRNLDGLHYITELPDDEYDRQLPHPNYQL